MLVKFNLNGDPIQLEIAPATTLLQTLRERLGLTGTKPGCEIGECGACMVLINGESHNACLTPIATLEGASVLTIEGLANGDGLHPIQRAFVEEGAIQCGYCTPGMVLAAKAFLDKKTDLNERSIREALSGNLCRCTGYGRIVAAVLRAGNKMEGKG